jgi:hypothetical protein
MSEELTEQEVAESMENHTAGTVAIVGPGTSNANRNLGRLMMMGMMMGLPMLDEAHREIEGLNRKAEDEVRHVNTHVFDNFSESAVKVSPDDYLITVGPGEIEDRFYAVIMRPDPTLDPPFKTEATSKYGFDTALEAKMDAAQQFPALPVLIESNDEGNVYEYPFFNPAPYLVKAQARRELRAAKLQKNQEKSLQGQVRTITYDDPIAVQHYNQGVNVVDNGDSTLSIFKVLKGPHTGKIACLKQTK